MKQVVQHNKTGSVKVEQVPSPSIKPGHLLVRTQFSVISAGTERASIETRKSSIFGKAKKNPELLAKVLEQVRNYGLLATYKRVRGRLESWAPLGYSAAGVVVVTGDGVSEFKPGDRVACAGGGYASHAEYMLIPKNLCAKIPKIVSTEEAAYTTIGSIALQGVRQGAPTLGETFVVIGLGLVGQLAVQILKANGCAVIGVDLDPAAVKLAKESGADLALHRLSDDVNKVVATFTKGIGADAVVITAATTSDDPVRLAGELCREKGRVVLVGDVGLQLPRAPYYVKELDFRLSKSYGPGRYDSHYEERGEDYPVGYVRWTENRNMQEFLRLLAEKDVDVNKLTTHRFAVDRAKEAYALISAGTGGKRERYFGVLLEYGDQTTAQELVSKVEYRRVGAPPEQRALNVGFLGAGSFAQGMLLPAVRGFTGAKLMGVCTGSGLNATNVAKGFGFQFATTDPKEVIDNEAVGTIYIASRHNLHARYTVEALKAGKNVFVEKPLAINETELREIQKVYRSVSRSTEVKSVLRPAPPQAGTSHSGILMVGFNRRFAPYAIQAKEFFRNAVGPFVINYRVNAGYVSRTHWTQDPVEGGGRIIGEVCHFVDLIQYFTNSKPVKVYAERIGASAQNPPDDDSVGITIKCEDGSVGVITYLANGDSALPKEYIELHSTGRTAILDNFRKLTLFSQGKQNEYSRSTVDKGHREEVRQFLFAVRDGKESPISFESLVTTTMATFRIEESLKLGVPVTL